MTKTKYPAIKGWPGIMRVMRFNKKSQRYEEPLRGRRFAASAYIQAENGTKKKVKEFFSTFEEAKKFRQSIVIQKSLENKYGEAFANEDKMKFEELLLTWERFIQSKVMVTTLDTYQSYFKHYSFFNGMLVRNIKSKTIDEWIFWLKQPEKLKAQHKTRCSYEHELTCLKSILGYYSENIYNHYRLPFRRDHSEMVKIKKKPPVEKYVSSEDFLKFLNCLKKRVWGTSVEKIYWIAQIQYLTYGRIGEAYVLHVEDFDFRLGQIRINKRVVNSRNSRLPFLADGLKSSTHKDIPIDETILTVFKEFQKRFGIIAGPMFQESDGSWIRYRKIAYRYNQAMKDAGLPTRGTHFVRHSSVSEFHADSGNAKFAQAAAGHTSLRMTDRYIHNRDSAMVTAVRKFREGIQRQAIGTGHFGSHSEEKSDEQPGQVVELFGN